jgi:hypothetical protein
VMKATKESGKPLCALSVLNEPPSQKFHRGNVRRERIDSAALF